MSEWSNERPWYNDRTFEAFISKEEIDKQKDLIKLAGLEEVMDWFVKYGVIHYKHSFINFGEPLAWKRESDGIKIKAGAHTNYKGLFPIYDWVWDQVKKYYAAGIPGFMSIGGQKLDAQLKCDAFAGSCYNEIRKLGIFEASWVGASPANSGAAVTNVNLLAKSDLIEKKVEKRGDKWCVIHCHGPDAGKAIKCFDTETEAESMHRAIMANKSMAGNMQVDEDLLALAEFAKQLTSRPQHEEHPAPKEWWEKCVRYAKDHGASDPEAYCGALWFHVGPSAAVKNEQKEVVPEPGPELKKEAMVETEMKKQDGEPVAPPAGEANPIAMCMQRIEAMEARLSALEQQMAPKGAMEAKTATDPASGGKPGEVRVSFKSELEQFAKELPALVKGAVQEFFEANKIVTKSTVKPSQAVGGQDSGSGRPEYGSLLEKANKARNPEEFLRT